MKHKGAVMEFAQERIDELIKRYYEYIASCSYIRMSELYASIVDMPASRFWVSDTRACVVVMAIMRGEDVLESMWPLKREMYLEIYNRVLALKNRYAKWSILELCAEVVEQPAPKFYLTPGSAKIMICKERKRWKEERRENISR